MEKFEPKHIVRIIGAVLVFLGGIFVAMIHQQCGKEPEKPRELDFAITLRDADTGERIAGYVFINNAKLGTFIDPIEIPPTIPLVQGRYSIRVESDGYVDIDREIDHIGAPLDIPMRKMQKPKENSDGSSQIVPVLSEPAPIPLPMFGWYPWKGVTITDGAASNERIFNSRGRIPDSAGIVNEHLGSALRGKTLILCFSNTRASRFSEGRMAKLEADNLVLLADNSLSIMYYLPVEDRFFPNGFEFKIPDTFNGKLNIVFYQAELKDLKIAAYYK